MNDSFPEVGRYISILDRLMRMYYDHGLSEFEIGWGQQFYVEYIYDHPGASAQEMVEYRCFCFPSQARLFAASADSHFPDFLGY